ncbi:MAG TPA: C-terminal binding protein [Chloroflexia bacterium]|nr:C-terminal binding protein [Chloroflexia bacterium]
MKRFKVVLADTNEISVPEWVAPELAAANIDFVVQDCRSAETLAACAGDADIVWVWGSRIVNNDTLDLLPNLGAIVRTGSGTDNVPVAAATERGIVVAHTPQAHNEAVAEHAIALLFAVMRSLVPLDRQVRAGQWRRGRSERQWHLRGQTLGLVGFGHIARAVARKLSGFELTTLVYDPFISAETITAAGFTPATLEEMLSRSDVVSLHCPLTPQTQHLIGERELKLMRPRAILINTARGPVVDEPALLRALTEGWIAAAGLDVLEAEPPDPANPLFALDNVVLTPHTAGQSDEDQHLAFQLSVEAIIALAQGRWPRAYVNRSVQPRWTLA